MDRTAGAPIWVPSLDGIRGFVTLSILLWHVQLAVAWIPRHEFPRALQSQGFFAVELLFLVAGFVAMLSVVAAGAFSGARRYAIRRAGRLLPLYWLTIALAVALGGLLRPVTGLDHPHDVGTVLLHLTFLQHLVIPFKSGFGVHGVVWTMTIAACFYVAFAATAPWYLRHPLLGLAIGLAIAVAWRTQVDILSRWYLQFPLFLSNFTIGMTAAWAYVRLRRSGPRVNPAVAAVVSLVALAAFVVLLYVAGLAVMRHENLPFYDEGVPLNLAISAAFAALLVALPFAPRWFQWPAANRAARWMGTVSYGTFLFHFMVIWLVLRFVDIPRNGSASSVFELLALVLPISLLSAWLGTRYVEDPVRRRARRAGDRLGRAPAPPPVAFASTAARRDRMTKLTDADRRRLEELNQPAERGGRHGVTRYLFDVYRARPDLEAAWPDLDGEDGERLVEWAHVHGRLEVPIIDELLPPPPAVFRHHLPPGLQHPPLRPPPLGVNVLGPLRSEVGLGEASRLVVKALDAVDMPTLPAEGVVRPHTRREHDFARGAAGAASFPISILCTNPPGYFALLHELGEEWFRSRVSIGFWWWEAQGAFPLEWRAAEEHLSEVWAASQYVADALEPFLSVPVVPMRLAVAVDEPPQMSRAELGLPDDFLFLFVFDYYSTVKRKNPLAVVEAFRRAFPPGSGASLVMKCNNPRADPAAHRALLAAAAAHPDLRVMPEYLASERKDALIAACDCYVSLHRAEGFGLTGAEAMYLGKPVIATGFSGNLDYMTPANSYLVDWTPTRVGPGADPYPAEGTWAEPDVAHAAALMREVFDDPQAAAARGRRGAQDIRRTHAPAVAGAAMEERLRALAPRATGIGRSAATAPSHRVAALLETGPAPPPRSPLGPIGRLARRVVLRLIRPFSEYERMINEELLAGLREAEAAAERTAGFELEVAHARAEGLAASRRNGRVRASSNGHYPSLDVETRRRLQAEIDAIPYWWHSIDLGDGVVTPGAKYGDLGGMRAEWDALGLPDLRGATVLDVGAWDGFYSFEAERRGAARVVALDHFVWSIDPAAAVADGGFRGLPHAGSAPGVWDPERLPGKRGFDLAHRALGSGVESVVVDFMTADADELGTFDVVLFLGVLYHLRDPLGALRRLRALTGGVAVIESEAIVVPGQEDRAVCEFLSGDQLNADPTNWWVPNLRALHDLCEAAGFGRTETVLGPPSASEPVPADVTEPGHYRAIVHAFP